MRLAQHPLCLRPTNRGAALFIPSRLLVALLGGRDLLLCAKQGGRDLLLCAKHLFGAARTVVAAAVIRGGRTGPPPSASASQVLSMMRALLRRVILARSMTRWKAPSERGPNVSMAEAARHLCDASSGTRGERPSLSAPAIAKPIMTTAQNNRQSAVNWRMRVRWRSLIPAQSSRDRRRRHAASGCAADE